MKRYAIDIDGVVADFTERYGEVLQATGAPLHQVPRGRDIWDWHWDDHGVRRKHANKAWERIGESPGFWLELRPLVTPGELQVLRQLVRSHQGCFVSSRRGGNSVALQTELWLRDLLGEGLKPLVITEAGDKVQACKDLKIDVAVDDSPLVLPKLAETDVKVYAMAYPYNEHIQHPNIRRVGGLKAMFKLEGLWT